MIAALSAADQRRRRTDPVETATPRSSHFASLLPSNITITRSSPLLQAKQASQPLPLKKGARTPLTKKPIRGVRRIERAVEDVIDPQAEVVRGYCAAVRSAITDDGHSPLAASGLKLKGRLEAVADSLDRVAEKGGSTAA